MTKYLLDANVFIEAKRRHYGFDFCPAFWEWLLLENAAGRIFSIEKVGDELRRGEDVLSEWAGNRGPDFFLREDATLLPSLGATSLWAQDAGYEPTALQTFFETADFYLVAFAHAHNYVLVTHEVAQVTPKRVKIPNACLGLGIKFTTPWAMLRQGGARFTL